MSEPRHSARPPEAPEFLGDFQLVEEVRSGGMGTVYRAIQRGLDRVAAVKILFSKLVTDERAVRRFRHEGRIAARLSHGNIVRIFDAGLDGGRHYIAMEYLEGTSLDRLVASSPSLSIEEASQHVEQVARALSYAHDRGVIHRDIKASNVISDQRLGRAVLIDFGIARLGREWGEAGVDEERLGTPTYMAPELIRGEAYDRRADIYALGVLYFIAVAGRPPFLGKTPGEVMDQHLSAMPPQLESLRTDAPEWLGAIVDRCMAKDPGDRYTRASEMARHIQLGVAGRGVRVLEELVEPASSFTFGFSDGSHLPFAQDDDSSPPPGVEPPPGLEAPRAAETREPAAPAPRRRGAGCLALISLLGALLVAGALYAPARIRLRVEGLRPGTTAFARVEGQPAVPLAEGEVSLPVTGLAAVQVEVYGPGYEPEVVTAMPYAITPVVELRLSGP